MSEPVQNHQPREQQSPDAIERDLERTRSELDRTLDALGERLSPGRLLDVALHDVRENVGTDFVRALGDSVRRNPWPVAITAVGLGWLMLSSGRSGAARTSRGYPATERWPDAPEPATETGAAPRPPEVDELPTGPEDDPSAVGPVVPPHPEAHRHAEDKRP